MISTVLPYTFVKQLAKPYRPGGFYPDYQDISIETVLLLGEKLLSNSETREIFSRVGTSGDLFPDEEKLISEFVLTFVNKYQLTTTDPKNLIISTVLARRISSTKLKGSETRVLRDFASGRLAKKLPISSKSDLPLLELSEVKLILGEIDRNERLTELAAPLRSTTYRRGVSYFEDTEKSDEFFSEFEGYAARSLVQKHALFNRDDSAIREIPIFVGWYLEGKIDSFLDQMVIDRLLSQGREKVVDDLGDDLGE